MCLGCRGDFFETLGTPLHAKQVHPDKLVWALAAPAEGLGSRAVARVFEVNPNTVLGWLVRQPNISTCGTSYERYFLSPVAWLVAIR